MSDARRFWLLLALTWCLSVGYAAAGLNRGWFPHDEGTLGQSADRVLAGQLPHRDYDEIYTGGLAFADAAAFRVFGDNLVSPRLVLLLVFALWVPATFYVASRFFGPVGAGGVTLAAVAWSMPNYSAAMPSWFNLFFAGLGVACLIRHTETAAMRWVFWAGVCGGLSCLAKIIGLYYIAGALLFLVYREQSTVAESSQPGSPWFRVLVGSALLLFLAGILDLLRGRWTGGDLALFFLPSGVLVALLLSGEPGRGVFRTRLAALSRSVAVLAAGVAVPVVLFLLPYIVSHSLGAIAYDVFVAPTRRFTFAAWRAPGLNTTPNALLFVVPVVLFWWRPTWRRWVAAGTAALLGVVWVLGFKGNYYRIAWNSFQWLVPLTVIAAALVLRRSGRDWSPLERQQTFALIAVAAVAGLVQFPFSHQVYFLYIAPLAVVAAAVVLEKRFHGAASWPVFGGALLVFAALFPLRWLRPSFVGDYGVRYRPVSMAARLPGTGLLVSTDDSAEYTGMTALVGAHVHGRYLYATPDCPEVNVLTHTRNPTRTLFDFFDDPVGRTGRILARLDSTGVTAVVLNSRPGFSGPVPTDLAAALAVRYPHAATIGRFEVRWRE
ncbi:MAG TPA: hypothetical protein VJN62_13395 [Gemmatimonadales bacterium]|nr:hypothetical protein [Gemmatimonadales bacterium]